MEISVATATFWIKKINIVSKNLVDLYKNNKNKKMRAIKDRNPRQDHFKFRGITDKSDPGKIELCSNRKGFEDIKVAFNSFNNRFDIFSPSVKSFNNRYIRRQVAKTTAYGKQYSKYLSLFHKNKFSKFIFKDGEKYKPEDIIESNSRITWIKGDIGCGKSTFISHMCHAMVPIVNKGHRAIMCINFNEDKLKPHYEVDSGEDSLVIDNASHKKIIYKILNESFRKNFTEVPYINNEIDFINVIKRYFPNTPVTIIVDNLDMFYDQSSTLILEEEDHKEEFRKFYNSKKYTHIAVEWLNFVLSYINSPDAPLNVNFIFGVRCETYDALISTVKKQLTNPSVGKNIPNIERKISLSSPDVSDVINKRFEMVRNPSSTDNDYSSLKKFFISYGEQSIDIKIHGMRHLISSLNEFCELGDDIFYPEWMVDIYIYLDGYKKYSQCDCGILNMFLVNIDYRIDRDRKRNEKKYPEYSKQDHYQSYWLKYLISLYFHKKLTNELVDSDILYGDFDSYERGIFNSSLYSLTRDTHGRLVSCNHNHTNIDTDDYFLEKQDRLGLLFEKEVFFSFTYLSVIVDDDYLEIPRLKDDDMNEKLKKIFEHPFVYNSIFSKNDEWKEWLFISITKVYVFMNILRSSLDNYESGNISFLEDCDIDFDKTLKSIDRQVKDIAKTLSISELDIDDKLLEVSNFNTTINSHLDKHFSQYKTFVDRRKSIK